VDEDAYRLARVQGWPLIWIKAQPNRSAAPSSSSLPAYECSYPSARTRKVSVVKTLSARAINKMMLIVDACCGQ